MSHRVSTRTLLVLGALTLGASPFARSAAADDPRGGIVPAPRTGVFTVGPPEVKVFDGKTAAPLAAFFAYEPKFKGGVFVAAGN